MSKRELSRSGILARVKAGDLRLKDGGVLMRVSYRHAKRMWKRYRAGGAATLKHGNAGSRSHRARPAKERNKILKLVREKYDGFGPTLAAEHLASEDKQQIHAETLRRWMLAEDLWKRVLNHDYLSGQIADYALRPTRNSQEPDGPLTVLLPSQRRVCFENDGSTGEERSYDAGEIEERIALVNKIHRRTGQLTKEHRNPNEIVA